MSDRFLDKCVGTGIHLCIEWTGTPSTSGYGQYKPTGNSNNVGAHRYAWELFNGSIPAGMCVCHKCDNRKCVNVFHMFLGTHEENMKDMDAKGRRVIKRGSEHYNSQKARCEHGHAFSPENTYKFPSGKRACKECRRITDRKRKGYNAKRVLE